MISVERKSLTLHTLDVYKRQGIPVKYIGVGESIDDLQKFNSDDFVDALFLTKECLKLVAGAHVVVVLQ